MSNALARAHTKWGHVRVVEGSGKPAGKACLECPLREHKCVPTERRIESPAIAIVGEAPGFNEVKQGRPFIGASGASLNKLVGGIGFNREDVLWTNAALCGVPQGLTELRKATKLCRDRLQWEIAGITHVVPVGAYALQSVLGLPRKPKILEYRGTVIRKKGQTILPTIHPAFVLRSPLWEEVIQSDFKRIKRVVQKGWVAPEQMRGRTRLLVKTIDSLEREFEDMDQVVSLDVETTEEPAWKNKLVCFSITGLSAKKTVVVPWSKTMSGDGAYFGRKQRLVVKIVNEFLSSRVAITHNGPAFDHVVLERHGINVDCWEDTLLAHHAFASHMPQRLSHVVSMYCDVPPWKDQREETLKDLYRYNSQDTLYTVLAWKAMQSDLDKDREIYELDRISSELCKNMQVTGFRYDTRRAKKLGRRLIRKSKEATRKAQKIACQDINLASPLQLRKVFFDKFDAPVFFKSEKTDLPALNVDALRAYAGYADEKLRDLANAVLDFRKAQKVYGTYIKPIEVDSQSRVHPSWRCYGTVSGRYACREPNLMNLPRPENDPSIELGGIRSLYVASRGHTLVGFDCAQLEMRIAAYVSEDEAMISACETDDLHSANATLLFGDEFTKAEGQQRKMLRTIAKTSGFAIAYMASAPTVYTRILAQGLPMNLQQVEALLKKMRQTFPTYYRFQDDLLHDTMRLGYVSSPLTGRRRWLGHAPKPTDCANFPIQGGAADHMNLLLPKIVDALPWEAKLVAQIHDAAIFDVPEKLADKVSSIIQEVATRPVEVKGREVVFPIDLKAADKWSEL